MNPAPRLTPTSALRPLALLVACLGSACAGNLAARIPDAAALAARASPTPKVHFQGGAFEAKDGSTLFEESWRPVQGPPRAALIVVHGLKDDGDRYAQLATELAERGWAVHAYDQRGHGHSAGVRSYVDRFSGLTDDLGLFIARVRAAEPGVPLFLFGHSMGGAVATLGALQSAPQLAGLVLSAPALGPTPDVSGPKIAITRMLSALTPTLRVVPLDPPLFSRDPQVVAAMHTDPLVDPEQLPARMGAELLVAFEQIKQGAGALRLPLLVVHGTHDQVTNLSDSQALVAAAGSADKQLVQFDGAFHDLLHDSDAAKVRAEIERWLEAHLPR